MTTQPGVGEGQAAYWSGAGVAWVEEQKLLDHVLAPFERLLVDTAVAPSRNDVLWINPRIKPGEQRRVMTGIPGKTGVVYTLDRQTGEFLWARPTIEQNVVDDIDGGTGAVTVNPEAVFTASGQSRFICPSLNGGKNWQAGAYSPLTNVMYYPLQNTCMTATAQIDKPTLTSLYGFGSKNQITAGTNNVGTIHAISAETGHDVTFGRTSVARKSRMTRAKASLRSPATM